MSIFATTESEVRVYSRRFPVVFTRGSGCYLWDERGERYVDFLSGAGALNYGHNHPLLKRAAIDYLAADGIVMGLDLHTTAKGQFLERFVDTVLRPRDLDYKVQFTGPTGTNAVEAAFKLARKLTGRTSIAAFTNGFHGMSLGALAASSTGAKRAAAGVPLTFVQRLPYDGYLGDQVDTTAYLERLLDDPGSGFDRPAAIIFETVQGEGGIQSASGDWLRRLAVVARKHSIVLIADEIQTGCGRTGPFFSFEGLGIAPDIVCLAKSISGIGLPMALMLMKRELDIQQPGEHSGTFRGNNLAFVTGSAALGLWQHPGFASSLAQTAAAFELGLQRLLARHPHAQPQLLGRGMLRGIRWADTTHAVAVARAAFEGGLLLETSGADGRTLKLMPSLLITADELGYALQVLETAIATCSAGES